MELNILIIEDDFSFGEILKNWLLKKGHNPVVASSMNQAKKIVESQKKFDIVLSDLRLPDGDGILFLSWLRERKDITPVIVITSYAEISTAVASMKIGASDYMEKPFSPELLEQKINQITANKTLRTTKSTDSSLSKSERPVLKSMNSKNREMQTIYQQIGIVAPTKMSVLVLGESGTGKEYIARMIYEKSDRAQRPFVAVDCGVLSKELAPSELFGHVKGAFTSADGDKKGVFEQADGGTIFLDEIENLQPDVQTQLLRALQEKKIRPIGSSKDVYVDVRIIAATNENLKKLMGEGRFREDLFHRINELELHLPALRDRMEDIPQYAAFFMEEANKELGQEVTSFSKETLELLVNYHWSGNLRELRNVVRRAVLFTQKGEITPQTLPDYLLEKPEKNFLELTVEDEKEQIETVLRIVKGNKAAAARLLKISRKTLYNKLHQYGLEI